MLHAYISPNGGRIGHYVQGMRGKAFQFPRLTPCVPLRRGTLSAHSWRAYLVQTFWERQHR